MKSIQHSDIPAIEQRKINNNLEQLNLNILVSVKCDREKIYTDKK